MRNVFSLLKKLLLLPWRLLTWIREILANLILLAVIILILVVVMKDEAVPVPKKGALVIAPSGALVEQLSYVDPVMTLFGDEHQRPPETLLHDLMKAIDQATSDPHITALVIDVNWLDSADPAKLLSLGDAILRFRKSSKPVYAIGDSYTQAQYLLASHASQVYLHPMGSVFMNGFGAYPNYFKDALDKLHVRIHVFRVGDYKSFVEPFVRNDMSEESRSNTALWLGDIWKQVTARIETQRKLQNGGIDDYINQLDARLAATEGNAAQLALEAGLVDKIATREEMKRLIMEKAGPNENGDSFAAVDVAEYVKGLHKQHFYGRERVGVIVASGNILDGYHPPGNIGGESLAELIRQAREDEQVKALVLRIDSPGGSAFASEIIREEIDLTRAAGIPVIASFGGVAASGGFWIASTADEIWSQPSTITGSIGVFGMIPVFDQSLAAIGVHSDGVGTTALADAWHLDRPMNPILERATQLEVEHTYKRFIELVASGRKTSQADIHVVAQGQVWSGVKAKELGLVDQLGDLDGAIAAAAVRAKLGTNYDWEFIEEELSPREQFFRSLTSEARAWFGATRSDPATVLLAAIKREWSNLLAFNDPKGVYARCLECRVR